MKLSKVILSVMVLAAVGLTGCGKKKDNSSSVVDGRGARAGVNGGVNSGGVATPNGSQQFGYLQGNGSQFQELVKTLVSPTLDPQFLGQVDPYSGIAAAGQIELSRDGSIRPESAFRLEIKDSFVGPVGDGSVIEPYLINLSNGQGTWQGQVDNYGKVPNGTANIVFQDNFGTIRINGTWNTTYFSGTVTFRNLVTKYPTSLSSQCSQSECTLGQVQLPISAFFRM